MTPHMPDCAVHLVDHKARLIMRSDTFGPSRCLGHFASLNILPRRVVCERLGDGTLAMDFEFEPDEDKTRVNRALAKLSALPVMLCQAARDYPGSGEV